MLPLQIIFLLNLFNEFRTKWTAVEWRKSVDVIAEVKFLTVSLL